MGPTTPQPESNPNMGAQPNVQPPQAPSTSPAPPPAPDMLPGQVPSPVPSGSAKKARPLKMILIIVGIVLLILGALTYVLLFKSMTSTNNDEAKQTATTEKPAASASSTVDYTKCLTKTELASFDKEEYTLRDIDGTYYQYETFFFLPNSTSYEYADQVEEDYAAIKEFAAPLKDKQWKIALKGQIKDVGGTGNSADNKKLANDRAAKVQSDLIAKAGIEASRIELEEPEIYDVNEITPGDSDRNVSFTLSTQCAAKQIEKLDE